MTRTETIATIEKKASLEDIQVADLPDLAWVKRAQWRRMDPLSKLALSALYEMGLQDLASGVLPHERGICLSSRYGASEIIQAMACDIQTKGVGHIRPNQFPMTVNNGVAGQITIAYQFLGSMTQLMGKADLLEKAESMSRKKIHADRAQLMLAGVVDLVPSAQESKPYTCRFSLIQKRQP